MIPRVFLICFSPKPVPHLYFIGITYLKVFVAKKKKKNVFKRSRLKTLGDEKIKQIDGIFIF